MKFQNIGKIARMMLSSKECFKTNNELIFRVECSMVSGHF
jgi:hypothetical protein